MTGPDVEIADITFDCSDPERVATFWSLLLSRPIAGRKGPYVWLERRAGGIGLGFQRVAETKAGKNRLHLDVSGPDIIAMKERVVDLGGHRVDGYDDGGFLVMADPEGNEFCVVPVAPVNFDDEGRTRYLKGLEV
jgi:predicted enzyme related to lactoylglutathione lyase